MYRLVGGMQKKASVVLSTLLDGHGQDAAFCCAGRAVAGLCDAARHGLAFSVAGSLNGLAMLIFLCVSLGGLRKVTICVDS